jgi:hypothetical protein
MKCLIRIQDLFLERSHRIQGRERFRIRTLTMETTLYVRSIEKNCKKISRNVFDALFELMEGWTF